MKMVEINKSRFAVLGPTKLSYLNIGVIMAFFPEGKERTIKEIIEKTEYSYERVNFSLKSLTENKIVSERKVGKTLVYSLNLDNLYAGIGFSHYILERVIEFIRKHKTIYNAIKEIEADPYILGVVLFGSYSKGKETKQSDVDILCLSTKKEETERLVKSLKYKYGVEFAPVILPPHNFSDIKKENPELWNDLKLYGISFKGTDTFYYWMYKNEKS